MWIKAKTAPDAQTTCRMVNLFNAETLHQIYFDGNEPAIKIRTGKHPTDDAAAVIFYSDASEVNARLYHCQQAMDFIEYCFVNARPICDLGHVGSHRNEDKVETLKSVYEITIGDSLARVGLHGGGKVKEVRLLVTTQGAPIPNKMLCFEYPRTLSVFIQELLAAYAEAFPNAALPAHLCATEEKHDEDIT